MSSQKNQIESELFNRAVTNDNTEETPLPTSPRKPLRRMAHISRVAHKTIRHRSIAKNFGDEKTHHSALKFESSTKFVEKGRALYSGLKFEEDRILEVGNNKLHFEGDGIGKNFDASVDFSKSSNSCPSLKIISLKKRSRYIYKRTSERAVAPFYNSEIADSAVNNGFSEGQDKTPDSDSDAVNNGFSEGQDKTPDSDSDAVNKDSGEHISDETAAECSEDKYKRSTRTKKNKLRSVAGRTAGRVIDDLTAQSENEGVQGANVERKAIWRGIKDGARTGHRWSKGHAARIEKRELRAKNKELIRESKEKLYQTQHGKPSTQELKRKKSILKKQRMKAAAEKKLGEKTVSILEKIISTASKLAGAAIRVAVAYIGAPLFGVFLIFGLLFLIAFLFAGTILNTATVVISSYTAENTAIEQASAYYTQLEAEMEKKILDAPTSWEWGHIDEFRYDLDPIGHDPYQIMAYLNVKHPGFTLTPQSPEDSSFEEVKTEIDYIFDKRYDLIFDEEIEVRSYTVDYTDPDGTSGSYTVYYNYYILNIILRSREQETVLLEELAASPEEDLTEWYEVLQQSQGARQDYANPLPFDWRENVSSLYGYRIDPIGGRELQMHRGLDIAAPRGTPIVAGISGRVRYTGFDPIMGNYIILDDGSDRTVKYGHCDSIEVDAGAEVVAGETIIGTVGNTGQSTGAHLHVEIMELGDYLNPVYSLNFAA